MDEMDGKRPASNRLPVDGEVEKRQDDGPATAAMSAAAKKPVAVHADKLSVDSDFHEDEFEEPEGSAVGVQHADALDFEEEEERDLDPAEIERYQLLMDLGPDQVQRDYVPFDVSEFLRGPGSDSKYVRAALDKFKREHLPRGYRGGLRHLVDALGYVPILGVMVRNHMTDFTDDRRYKEVFKLAKDSGHVTGLAPLSVEMLSPGNPETVANKYERASLSFHYLERVNLSEKDTRATSLLRDLNPEEVWQWIRNGGSSLRLSVFNMQAFLKHADEETIAKVMKQGDIANFMEKSLPSDLTYRRSKYSEDDITRLKENCSRCLTALMNSDDPEKRMEGLKGMFKNSFWIATDRKLGELAEFRASVFRTMVTGLLDLAGSDEVVKLLSNKHVYLFAGDRGSSPLDFMLGGQSPECIKVLVSLLVSRGDKFDLNQLFNAEPRLIHEFISNIHENEGARDGGNYRLQTMVYEFERNATLGSLQTAKLIREALAEKSIDLESIKRPPVAAAVHADEPKGYGLGEARDATERAIMADREINEKERANRLGEYRARPSAVRSGGEAASVHAAVPAEGLARLNFEEVPEGRRLNWAISRVLSASVEHADNEALYSSLHADLATLVRHGETRAADYVANYLHNTFNDLYDRGISPEGLLVHLYWEARDVGDDALATGVQSMLGGRLTQLENEEAEHYLYMHKKEFEDAEKSGEITQSIKNEMYKRALAMDLTLEKEVEEKKALEEKVAYFEELIEAYGERKTTLQNKELALERLERFGGLDEEAARRVDKLKGEILDERKALEVLNRAREEAMAAGSPPAWRAKIAKLQAEFKRKYSIEDANERASVWLGRGARPPG